MNFKLYMMPVLLGLGLISASANATVVAYQELVPSPQTNDGSINLPPSGFTATYSPTAPVSSIWFSDSVSPQNATNVANSIINASLATSLTLEGQNDSFASTGIVSLPNNPFNVLAVHLGGQGNELVFIFSSLVTSFTVNTFSQGGSNNLSNFRAYEGSGLPPVSGSPVPVPAALWLFSSALAGFGVMTRRKSIKTA
jgi:hypothetical protein